MAARRIPVNKFQIYCNTRLNKTYRVSSKKLACITWGAVGYYIVVETLLSQGKNIRFVLNKRGRKFCTEAEFISYLNGKNLKVVLGRLIFRSDDNFDFIFKVSRKYGVEPGKLRTQVDWFLPSCIRFFYTYGSSLQFTPEERLHDSSLQPVSYYPNSTMNAPDGNVTSVFFYNEDYDVVEELLIPFYQARPTGAVIEDIELQAKAGKRVHDGTGSPTPIQTMDANQLEKYWDYKFDEFGAPRKASFLVKYGKCPIGSASKDGPAL